MSSHELAQVIVAGPASTLVLDGRPSIYYEKLTKVSCPFRGCRHQNKVSSLAAEV